MAIPTLQDIKTASDRTRQLVHRTPVLTCTALNRIAGAEIFFKCENLQKTGSFKIRGASNAVFSLDEESARAGVVTHSSGNHGQALALAASVRGIPAHIVMPRTAPAVKKAAVAGYGGRITYCEPTQHDREARKAEVKLETGAVEIHPYDNDAIIAGQGTAALELLEEVPDLDVITAPVGGGGLISGTAIAATSLSPGIRVIGAEPALADDACRSLQAGRVLPSVNPTTIADGLLSSLCEKTFAIIRERVEAIVTVSEVRIPEAIKLVMERAKVVIEPSSAVPVGMLLEKKIDLRGLRVGVILSGGNVDLDHLPWSDPAR